ncbi:hypothetical protein [Micrococcus sp. TA1]|uniref:hypothetical protein n=1 Tax=Micrococcus sp. TA1 TaxID=681627 RepID=UPI001620E2FC|nr:hypothetical protein [Micrococcus sp. TA1]MBB5748520.1 hypothetical protein [Micrococcus sp. TA1]
MSTTDPREWLDKAQSLATEYRTTMDIDVVHDWAMEARPNITTMVIALAGVLDLHSPIGDARFVIQDCSQCEESYPCATVRALTRPMNYWT